MTLIVEGSNAAGGGGAASTRGAEGAVGLSILLVEDDRDIRTGLKEILEIEGYEVRSANDGAAALQLLEKGPLPRVILLDVMMPGMSGLDFRRAQRGHPAFKSIPIVLLTADARILERARELEAEGAVRKPFLLEELLGTVQRVLAGAPASVAS
jgi:CheY-like chemotaxis protein